MTRITVHYHDCYPVAPSGRVEVIGDTYSEEYDPDRFVTVSDHMQSACDALRRRHVTSYRVTVPGPHGGSCSSGGHGRHHDQCASAVAR